MIVYRGFVVWALGIIIFLGAFLYFVVNGWPGSPHGCIYNSPDTCYCEAFVVAEVEAGLPGVRQPVNTWFNLYALITSFIVAFYVCKDRKSSSSSTAPNQMRSTSGIADLYIFAVLFLGLGSMWFHGSLTAWGNLIDGISMYVFVAFLSFYSIRRIWESSLFFWLGYIITVALFSYLHTILPSFVNILILVGAYLGIEIFIWIRSGKVLQGKSNTITLWLLAIFSILLATFFWLASHTGNFMCDPHSFFQPHGLFWHPLAGVSAVLLYFYWREAEDEGLKSKKIIPFLNY